MSGSNLEAEGNKSSNWERIEMLEGHTTKVVDVLGEVSTTMAKLRMALNASSRESEENMRAMDAMRRETRKSIERLERRLIEGREQHHEPNGQILNTDNIMVAYELLHTMQSRQKGREGSMAIKLDISKAYDRVEWEFLQTMLTKLGFSDKCRKLIMACVKFVSYSVVVNGIPGDIIWPTRGLRSKVEEWTINVHLLKIYEVASRQTLNWQKTSILFSSKTNATAKECISQHAEGVICDNYNEYLGLPTMVGKSKYNTFIGLKERIWKRINSWKISFLSSAGKEIMIKSVLQAIPAYTISVFKLPKMLLKENETMIAKFWWNQKKEGRGIHWKSWNKLGLAKGMGGLGFCDLNCFNRALLANKGGEFYRNPHH
ncbi:uncharacterized protein LOC122312669 [Carya illinoinensis]|uniref:uncharacterized protein LOC122312669 n=1 Tax=Carya illinoinensis TaxID=32201 RepID=UPI001C7293B1|nr:uncharacterized protein LOC122312669 [Carya illinoinensis]